MFVNRPYVVSLVLVFIVIAAAERGWLRMVIWLVTAASIGWLSEFSSQRTGFPYGFYSYYPSSFANELWLSNVPFFASLSYAALSYLGYSLISLPIISKDPSSIKKESLFYYWCKNFNISSASLTTIPSLISSNLSNVL
jgi:uncharacterized membrane protein